jgi:hypothetical protein
MGGFPSSWGFGPCSTCGTRHALQSADHPYPTSVLPRGTAVFRFGSGARRAPAQILSNFWGCHVALERDNVRRCAEVLADTSRSGTSPRAYPLSEHAYVDLTVKPKTPSGAMASLEWGLAPYHAQQAAARGPGPCVGIAAKLFADAHDGAEAAPCGWSIARRC